MPAISHRLRQNVRYCHGSYRLQQTRNIHQFKLQIFRKVHPDLFANENSDVKSKNLKCMQSLNEFYETFSNVSSSKQEFSSKPSLFHPVYDFSCYIHDTTLITINEAMDKVTNRKENILNPSNRSNNSNAKLEFNFISFVLRPSKDLIRNSDDEKSKQSVTKGLVVLRNDFLRFVSSLGIECEAVEKPRISATEYGNHKKKHDEGKDDHISNAEQILNELAFERVMATSFNRSLQSLFSSTPYAKSKRNAKNDVIMAEIDYYIQNGLIYVNNMSTQQEFEVLEKFRNFLFDYGELISFSSYNWKNLIFIFNGEDVGTETMASTTYGSRFGSDVSSNISHKKTNYSCKYKNNMYVMEVPLNFKPKRLVMLLSENVDQISQYY